MDYLLNSCIFVITFLGIKKILTKINLFDEKLLIKFNNIHAKIPYRASEESAGLDLYSCEDGIIEPHSNKMIDIGISLKIPSGYYGRIAPRSGLTIKHSINVGAGVIDSDYRGNISVILFNHGDKRFHYNIGDKLAQLIIEKIAILQPLSVLDLDYTARGCNGFGSSGISGIINNKDFDSDEDLEEDNENLENDEDLQNDEDLENDEVLQNDKDLENDEVLDDSSTEEITHEEIKDDKKIK